MIQYHIAPLHIFKKYNLLHLLKEDGATAAHLLW